MILINTSNTNKVHIIFCFIVYLSYCQLYPCYTSDHGSIFQLLKFVFYVTVLIYLSVVACVCSRRVFLLHVDQ